MSENITTCLKCGNTMSEPVELQCFHAFCKKCLPMPTEYDSEVECPKCRQMSPLPDIDEFTHSFIDIISRQRHMSEKCSMINSNGTCHDQASFLCLRCDQSLCGNCRSQHGLLEQHLDGDIVSFESALDAGFQHRKEAGKLCPRHSDSMSQFCMQCHKIVCITCGVNDHKGHWVLSVHTALRHLTSDIQACSKQIQNFHDTVHKPRIAEDTFLKHDKTKILAELEDLFENISQRLNDVKQNYLMVIENIHTENVKSYHEKEARIAAYCSSAEHAQTKLSLVNKYGTEVDMLEFRNKLRKSQLFVRLENGSGWSMPKFTLSNSSHIVEGIVNLAKSVQLKQVRLKEGYVRQTVANILRQTDADVQSDVLHP